MFPVPGNELFSSQGTVTGGIQIGEDLLQLDRIIHVQEVLDKISQGGLFGNVLA